MAYRIKVISDDGTFVPLDVAIYAPKIVFADNGEVLRIEAFIRKEPKTVTESALAGGGE